MLFPRSYHIEAGLNGSFRLYSVGVIPRFPPAALWASLIMEYQDDRHSAAAAADGLQGPHWSLSRAWE